MEDCRLPEREKEACKVLGAFEGGATITAHQWGVVMDRQETPLRPYGGRDSSSGWSGDEP